MSKVVKNGRSKKYNINGKKLAKALENKRLIPRKLSEELSFHPGYLSKCIRTNTIGEHAIGMLMNYGITPSKYDAEIIAKKKTVSDIFNELPEEAKEEVYSEVSKAVEEAEKLEQVRINPDGSHSVVHPLNRNSGRYPWGEEDESPVEKALEEPGVVKIELTLDIVKLKAIVKQAVKEAYEEL